jgi:hypothetical protein
MNRNASNELKNNTFKKNIIKKSKRNSANHQGNLKNKK